MQTLEITAKSVQEATQSAAQKLNVAPERLRVTVLEETKGLFGKSSVRVRAEVIEAAAPVKEAAPAPAAEVPAEKAAPAKPERGGRGRGRGADKAVLKEPVAEAPAAEPVVEEVVAEAPEKKGRGRRGGRSAAAEAEPAATPEPTAAAPASASDEELVANEDDAEAVAEIVRELLTAAGVQVSVQIGGTAGKYVNVVLDGKDVAFLVGKHGEVLNALQYLVNIVIGRRLERQVRATLDGNDYRRRREEALTQLATRIAEQVKERGEEAVLDALPAFERRIVHKALTEIDGIQTYSEGEEPNRRVVIAPAD